MKYVTIKELFLEMNTIAAELFEDKSYPWEILPLISDFILEKEKLFQRMNMTIQAKEFGLQRMRR